MDFPPPMNRLPLHWACANETPNPDVVRILVDKYPHGVTAEDAVRPVGLGVSRAMSYRCAHHIALANL